MEKKPVKETLRKLYMLLVDNQFEDLMVLMFVFLLSGKLPKSQALASYLAPLGLNSEKLASLPNSPPKIDHLKELLEHSDYSTRQRFGQRIVVFWINDPFYLHFKQISPLQRNVLSVIRTLLDQNLVVFSRNTAHSLFEHLNFQVNHFLLQKDAPLILEVIDQILGLEMIPDDCPLYCRVKLKFQKIAGFKDTNRVNTQKLEKQLEINCSMDQISAYSSFYVSSTKAKSHLNSTYLNQFQLSEETQRSIKVVSFNL